MLYLGCPAWGLKSWVGSFLPAGCKQRDFLAHYSRNLNTVEGNTTFYALPDRATTTRWRDETPPGFKFCLKVPQSISHHKKLRGCEAELAEFADRLALLGDRCGPAFLQLPPTFTARQLTDLRHFLQLWRSTCGLAVEPRHSDFFDGASHEHDFNTLLTEFGAARCVFDTTALFSVDKSYDTWVSEAQNKKPKFALRHTRTGSFAFVRYVSHPNMQANETWLSTWASKVIDWLSKGDDVYFFIHHPNDHFAPQVIRIFHHMISQRATSHVALPALPHWGNEDTHTHEKSLQEKLF
jgi:uncharacterized protein YecE (DUF72 family)